MAGVGFFSSSKIMEGHGTGKVFNFQNISAADKVILVMIIFENGKLPPSDGSQWLPHDSRGALGPWRVCVWGLRNVLFLKNHHN